MIKENREFENMIEDVELFDSSPSFNGLVDQLFQSIVVALMK